MPPHVQIQIIIIFYGFRVAFFYDSVCEGGRFQLNFSMHSLTENATFYVLSNAFDVVGTATKVEETFAIFYLYIHI